MDAPKAGEPPPMTPRKRCSFGDVNIACTQWLRSRGLMHTPHEINQAQFRRRKLKGGAT